MIWCFLCVGHLEDSVQQSLGQEHHQGEPEGLRCLLPFHGLLPLSCGLLDLWDDACAPWLEKYDERVLNRHCLKLALVSQGQSGQQLNYFGQLV